MIRTLVFPGFAGEPRDFGEREMGVVVCDPFHPAGGRGGLAPETDPMRVALDRREDLEATGHRIAAWMRGQGGDWRIVGYSLGARLGFLAALASKCPARLLAPGGVFEPGTEARRERAARDESWAQAFAGHEPWENLWARWNAQAVFQNDAFEPRAEKDLDRQRLASALRLWSVARQPPMAAKLHEIGAPLEILVGEKDEALRKAWESALTVTQLLGPKAPSAFGQLHILPGAGHRLYRVKGIVSGPL